MLKIISHLFILLLLSSPSFASENKDDDLNKDEIFSLYEKDMYSGAIKVEFKSGGEDFVEYRSCGTLPLILIKYISSESYESYKTEPNEASPTYYFRMDYLRVIAIPGANIEVLQFCRLKYKDEYLDAKWGMYKNSIFFGIDLYHMGLTKNTVGEFNGY